jgi:hypothetical protein
VTCEQTEAFEPVADLDDAWEMFASADEVGSAHPLRHFGPLGFARLDTTATRVLRVCLVITDEPEDGDYWAWLDEGSYQPTCIAATEQAMTERFLIDQSGAPGPREEERVGLGRILRLRVIVIEEVFLRESTRRAWTISSAL